MDSFEELGVGPELVETLAAEGIERPTALQEEAIPVLRKGNNLVLAAGPGSGLLVAWVLPLLERLHSVPATPSGVILTGSREVADRLAESTARLAATTGHTVAALGSSWSLPERAHVVFGTPEDVLDLAGSSRLDLSKVGTIVLDQAQVIDRVGALEGCERVIDYLPQQAQRIVSALPVSRPVADLVERHCKRSLTVPRPEAGTVPPRGRVRFRLAPEPREAAALALAGELLAERARHVLFFCRSDDRAADLGDYLTLHGYDAGAPGDRDLPVWLGVEALSAREASKGVDGVVVVSCDVPPDPDTFDRRHGVGEEGVVIVLPRELAHLKSAARTAGYETVPFPRPKDAPAEIHEFRSALERAIAEKDTTSYLPLLEPLFERFDPVEIAAAAVALLRERKPTQLGPHQPSAPSRSLDPEPSWAKLFLSVGDQDGLRPGDLLGAITGEAGVRGDSVGKIDIREKHSVVEVHMSVARRVIDALNGTSIRGRAVRADFDRPRKGKPRASR